MTANLVVGDRIWLKFKLIQAFMVVLITCTCKNEKDPCKKNELEWSQHFPHYKSMGDFVRRSRAALYSPWSDLAEYPGLRVVLITCKNEEDQSKNEGKRNSFKSSENIQKKEGGSDRSVSNNQSSSVTLYM